MILLVIAIFFYLGGTCFLQYKKYYEARVLQKLSLAGLAKLSRLGYS
jgi:hypothetical protein